MGLEDAGPSRVRPDAGRRGDDRAARPGVRERRRDGDRGAPARRTSSTAPATTIVDHRTYTLCSDGDLQEGVASEAAQPRRPPPSRQADRPLRRQPHPARRADRRWPGRRTSSPGSTAYGWHTQRVEDGNDIEAIARGDRGRAADDRGRSLIAVRTHIGYGSPNSQDTQKAHGQPLGDDEVRLVKEAYGWDPDRDVLRPGRGARALPRGGRRPARHSSRHGKRRSRPTPRTSRELAAELRRRLAAKLRRRLGRRPQDVRDRRGGRHPQREPGGDPGARRARCRSCSAARPTCPSRT